MMVRRSLISSLVLAFLSVATSLAATEGDDMFVQRFTTQNGLSSNKVNDIVQDKNGFIWLATSAGLERYDGYAFKSFHSTRGTSDLFASNDIKMLDAQDDYILLLHDEVAEVFDQRTGNVLLIEDEALKSSTLRAGAFASKDTVYLGGPSGLFVHSLLTRETKLVECPDPNGVNTMTNIRSLTTDDMGNLWVTTIWHGVYFKSASRQDFSHVTYDVPFNLFATSIAVHDGKVYIGTWGSGIYILKYDGNGLYSSRLSNQTLGWLHTYSLAFDDRGDLWAGIPYGVRKVSFDGGDVVVTDPLDRVSDNMVREVKSTFVDASGNIWLSDQGNGVIMASYGTDAVKEINFLEKGLPFSEVTAIHQDGDGVIWAGINGAGLVRYDVSSDTIIEPDRVLSGIGTAANGIVSFLDLPSRSQLMLCTRYDGVYCLNLRGTSPVSMQKIDITAGGIRSGNTYDIIKTGGDILWVATSRGVSILLPSETTFTSSEPEALNGILEGDQVQDLLYDKDGFVWIATKNRGLFRVKYDPRTGTIMSSRHYSVEEGNAPYDRIQCLYEDSLNNIWAGDSSCGLLMYDSSSDTFSAVENSSSFPSGSICAITEDAKGMLWISTDSGFACYAPSTASKTVLSSDVSSHISNITFIPGSVWSDGSTVIFGGHRGLSICDPDLICKTSYVPKPLITDIEIPGVSMSDMDILPPYLTELTLRHHQRDLTISFSSISNINDGRVMYAYRMRKEDKDWRYAGSKDRKVTYKHLAPGRYVFEVKASSSPDVWTDVTALKIHVRRPGWMSLWAILLYVLFIGGVVGIIMVFKRRKEKAENELLAFREEVAHDSIPLAGTDLDKEFIAKVIKVIEDNLSNADFDVDALTYEMNMSNSTFYRKLKSITGYPPKEFIRRTRYKYACKYLLEKSLNISDVAYRVGFSNAKYFSQCFKKEFGKTPSQYISEHNKTLNNE